MQSASVRYISYGAIACFAALAPFAATGDFAGAIESYRAGKYADAHAQFLALAELGSGESQFNLGAMSLRGEGVEADPGVGVGWLRASVENGYDGITPARLAEGEAQLSEQQRRSALDILARYGRDALRERVLPREGGSTCGGVYSSPRSLRLAKPEFPLARRSAMARSGVVIVDFIVGVDGLARDPQVVAAAPTGKFDLVAVRAALRSRFTPAQLDGRPVERRYAIRTSFRLEDRGILWNDENIDALKLRADEGDAGAQFVIGMLGILDESLGIPQDRARRFMLSAAQLGNADAQYWIAEELTRGGSCASDVGKSRVWLQQAAQSPLVPAKLALLYDLLRDPVESQPAPYLQQLLKDIVAGESTYALKHVTAMLSGVASPQLKDVPLALQAAKKLTGLRADADPQVNEAIAAAYAINEDFKQAAQFQRRALRTAEDLGWNTQLIRRRLDDYTSGKVWTGDLFAVPPVDAARGAAPQPAPG